MARNLLAHPIDHRVQRRGELSGAALRRRQCERGRYVVAELVEAVALDTEEHAVGDLHARDGKRLYLDATVV